MNSSVKAHPRVCRRPRFFAYLIRHCFHALDAPHRRLLGDLAIILLRIKLLFMNNASSERFTTYLLYTTCVVRVSDTYLFIYR